MTRQNALLRLYRELQARRNRLAKKLTGELAYLHEGKAVGAAGDSADLAFAGDGDEMSSRLAELGDQELSQIEWALAQWNEGAYGICDLCQKPIALARLNALPHAPFCISCVRELETLRGGLDRPAKRDWGQVSDAQRVMQDQKVDLVELEKQMSKERPATSRRRMSCLND